MNAQTPCDTPAVSDMALTAGPADAWNDPNAPRWFVIQSHSQAERLVAAELARSGYTAFLPEVSIRVRDRVTPSMTRIVTRPLFPGYLFVQGFRDGIWAPVVYTAGVKQLFTTRDHRPIPVARGVVEAIQAAVDERMILRDMPPLASLAGVTVRIADGPFADQEGVCLWSNETRVRVLLQVFGGSVEATVGRQSVRV